MKGCRHFNGTCEPAVDVVKESSIRRFDSTDRRFLVLFSCILGMGEVLGTHSTTVNVLVFQADFFCFATFKNVA